MKGSTSHRKVEDDAREELRRMREAELAYRMQRIERLRAQGFSRRDAEAIIDERDGLAYEMPF